MQMLTQAPPPQAHSNASSRAALQQVVVRQTCGLGNQLFQYAAGRHVAKRFGAALRIAHEPPDNLTPEGFPRPVMLQKFSIRAHIGPATRFDRLALSTQLRLAVPSWLTRRAHHVQVIREQGGDAHFVYQPIVIEDWARTVYLLGYWQFHTIVESVASELRHEFSLREPPAELSQQQARRIAAATTPVSVHLRRGDYLLSSRNKVLPAEYYENALARMREQFPGCTFFVFSDDAKFARAWCAGRSGFHVVAHNDDDTAHEDLWLMSQCHHHIIANSTFSWWGAWLNARSDKHVIAPANWLGFRTAEIDIANPEWSLV